MANFAGQLDERRSCEQERLEIIREWLRLVLKIFEQMTAKAGNLMSGNLKFAEQRYERGVSLGLSANENSFAGFAPFQNGDLHVGVTGFWQRD